MRVLFTCHPGAGHFQPMVPLAKALLAAGHEVAFATAASFQSAVEKHGFTHHRAGLEWDESRIEQTVPDILEVSRLGRAMWILTEIFLDRSPRLMVPDLLAIAETYKPDLMIVSIYEVAGVMVAEHLEIPYVSCHISFRFPRWAVKQGWGSKLKKLRREFGFAPDPGCTAYGRHLDLCLFPETWNLPRIARERSWGRVIRRRWRSQPATALLATAMRRAVPLLDALARRQPERGVYIRPDSASRPAPPPPILDGLPDQPTAYVSLGTVFNSQFPEVFDLVLESIRDEAINLIVTLGPDGDPTRFGPQPANVRIERFIPQAELLPHVDLCVNHGGFGTVAGAMASGVPQVIFPLSADQPYIALMAREHGVALTAPSSAHDLMTGGAPLPVVGPERLTPDDIRELVMRAIASTDLRAAARRMQAVVQAQPGPEDVIEKLAAVASSR